VAEKPHILVVDDDRRLRDLLGRYMSENGFRVTVATDADNARAKLKSMAFDLLILDVMMPGEDGMALTKSLRKSSEVPILLLTAMAEPDDRIAGLESGADDYLTKPFEPRELLLRIRTILRRAPPPVVAPKEIRLGVHRFDLEREALFAGKTPVPLTNAEARLLKALASKPGETLSREALIAAAGIEATSRVVDVQVTRLRRKIEPNPKAPLYLQTVRGKGYALWPD
jgi:two-component system, OmpR family, phosphate regulon response regulator OmpR